MALHILAIIIIQHIFLSILINFSNSRQKLMTQSISTYIDCRKQPEITGIKFSNNLHCTVNAKYKSKL